MSHKLWGFLYVTLVSFHKRGICQHPATACCKQFWVPPSARFLKLTASLHPPLNSIPANPCCTQHAILLFPRCKNSLLSLLSDSLPLLWLLPSHSTVAQPAKDGVPRKGSTSASTAWLGQHKENWFNKIYFWRFYLSWSDIIKSTVKYSLTGYFFLRWLEIITQVDSQLFLIWIKNTLD